MIPFLHELALVGALVVAAPVLQERGSSDREELELRVTAGASEVGFGEGFPLMVVRSWTRGFEPDEWSDEVLAPLTVELVEESVREDPERIEETRRYRAYLFEVGEVIVPAPWFRARSGDGETVRVAFADELSFQVASALGEGDPGPAELPGDVLPAPFSWRHLVWPALLVALVLGAVGFVARRRRLRAVGAAIPLPEPPDARAVAALERLRGQEPRGREAVHAFFVAVSATVRAYVAERFGISVAERATEELLADAAAVRELSARDRAGLEELLTRSDLVKFARDEPGPDERARLVDVAESFVRETATRGPAGGGTA